MNNLSKKTDFSLKTKHRTLKQKIENLNFSIQKEKIRLGPLPNLNDLGLNMPFEEGRVRRRSWGEFKENSLVEKLLIRRGQ